MATTYKRYINPHLCVCIIYVLCALVYVARCAHPPKPDDPDVPLEGVPTGDTNDKNTDAEILSEDETQESEESKPKPTSRRSCDEPELVADESNTGHVSPSSSPTHKISDDEPEASSSSSEDFVASSTNNISNDESELLAVELSMANVSVGLSTTREISLGDYEVPKECPYTLSKAESIVLPDGVEIHVLKLTTTSRVENSDKTMLYFPHFANNLRLDEEHLTKMFNSLALKHILYVEYRGAGLSEATVDHGEVRADAQHIWVSILSTVLTTADVIVYGYRYGTIPAAALLGEKTKRIEFVLLEHPYRDVDDMLSSEGAIYADDIVGRGSEAAAALPDFNTVEDIASAAVAVLVLVPEQANGWWNLPEAYNRMMQSDSISSIRIASRQSCDYTGEISKFLSCIERIPLASDQASGSKSGPEITEEFDPNAMYVQENVNSNRGTNLRSWKTNLRLEEYAGTGNVQMLRQKFENPQEWTPEYSPGHSSKQGSR